MKRSPSDHKCSRNKRARYQQRSRAVSTSDIHSEYSTSKETSLVETGESISKGHRKISYPESNDTVRKYKRPASGSRSRVSSPENKAILISRQFEPPLPKNHTIGLEQPNTHPTLVSPDPRVPQVVMGSEQKHTPLLPAKIVPDDEDGNLHDQLPAELPKPREGTISKAGAITTSRFQQPIEESLKDSLEKVDESAVFHFQSNLLEQQKKHQKTQDMRIERKVWSLVDAVTGLCNSPFSRQEKYASFQPFFSMVDVEDMVVSATRFVKRYQSLQDQGLPHDVDIGVQYRIVVHDNNNDNNRGTIIGEQPVVPACSYSGISGTYTADDPFAYYPYHEETKSASSSSRTIVGTFVARLKGRIRVGANGQGATRNERKEYNSCQARLLQNNRPAVVVLFKSDQCLPLLQFLPANRVVDILDNNSSGNALLHDCHCRLQEIADECFNQGNRTTVTRALASNHPIFQPLPARISRRR